MGHYRFDAAVLAVMCIALPPAVRGADDPEKPIREGEEMVLFQDLPSVFGASKYEQSANEAPASISIITADEIQRFGYRTLSEILRSVRGFFTTYDRNYAYLGVRGFDRPGDYGTRALVLLDGHRLNDNIFEQTMIGTESLVDVEAIDRLEVIRGPSSSLYGTNAFLAVINIITKSGRYLKGTEVSAAGGSYSSRQGRVAYGAKPRDGPEIYLSGTSYNSGGQTLYFPEFDSPATNGGRVSNADGDRFERVFAKVAFGALRIEGGLSSREKEIPTASFGTTFNDGRARTLDKRAFLDLRYDREVTRTTRLVWSASYDASWYNGAYPYPASLFKDYGYGRWWTGEIQSISSLHGKHKLIGGAEIRFNAGQNQGSYDANPYVSYFEDRRRSSIGAFYVQDEYRVRANLILNAGVRYDHYDTFGGTTNPRIALIYAAGEDTTLKLLFGRAFRAPNAYELYYDDGGIAQKANPGLRPESIQTYEVSLVHTFGDRFRGVASTYRYKLDNLISLQTDPADGLEAFQNIDRARAAGIEFEVDGSFTHRLQGKVSYALQRSEDASTGRSLTNSPRHLAKANLTVPFLSDRLLASLEVQATSRRETVSGEPVGGFAVANLTLLSRNWKRGPVLSLSVFNVLDKRYGDPGGPELLQSAIPQDGRSVRVLAKYEF